MPWPFVVLIAVSATWAVASLFTAAMARTPLSRWVTGRARRPLAGGPPPVGRGTASVTAGAPGEPSQTDGPRGAGAPPEHLIDERAEAPGSLSIRSE